MISITDTLQRTRGESYLTGMPRAAQVRREAPTLPAELVELLERQPPEVHSALTVALRSVDAASELDEDLWGPPPDPAQVVQRALVNLLEVRRLERAVCEDAASIAEVTSTGSVESGDVWSFLGRGDLLAVRTDSGPRIPRWQVLDGGTVEGIREIAAEYPGDVVSLTLWMERPNDHLDGETPRHVLARGDVADVAMAARALAG